MIRSQTGKFTRRFLIAVTEMRPFEVLAHDAEHVAYEIHRRMEKEIVAEFDVLIPVHPDGNMHPQGTIERHWDRHLLHTFTIRSYGRVAA